MESRGWDQTARQHEAVMSNLMDLQARLRGDPASLLMPRDGRREEQVEATTVQSGDVSVTVGQAPADPERRLDVLRRRLQYLELEIDAYEQAAEERARRAAAGATQADVADLQHVVEERLTAEQDAAATEDPATE